MPVVKYFLSIVADDQPANFVKFVKMFKKAFLKKTSKRLFQFFFKRRTNKTAGDDDFRTDTERKLSIFDQDVF